jgi:REP element-mobilizing transposase RayT
MYYSRVQRRKRHHLPDEAFDGNNFVVYITVCAARRGRWLERPGLAVIVRDEILKLHTEYPVIGYCIMPDHVHFLICNSGAGLSRIMNLFKGRVSRGVRLIESDLEIWQAGYWDHIVRKEEGLYKTLQYVLLNPVRAALVEEWWDYEWLGAPLLGRVGPDFFTFVSAEDIVWRDVLGGGP